MSRVIVTGVDVTSDDLIEGIIIKTGEQQWVQANFNCQ